MKILYTLLFSLLLFATNAQQYELSTTTGTYTNLTGSESPHGDETWDDPDDWEYTFDNGSFTFFGQEYTEFNLLDGSMSFLNGTNYSSLGLGSDICDRAFDTMNDVVGPGSLSKVSSKEEMVGTEFVTKIEFNNAGFYDEIYDDQVSTDFVNFQIWLYMTSGIIEMRFGPNDVQSPMLSYDESLGPDIVLAKNIDMSTYNMEEVLSLQGDPSNPQLNAQFDTVPDDVNLNGTIPDGTIYTFTPRVNTATRDIADANSISISPNPTKEVLNITSNFKDLSFENYSILNSQGQQITRANLISGKQINVSALNTGLYILRIETSQGLVSKKFVVE